MLEWIMFLLLVYALVQLAASLYTWLQCKKHPEKKKCCILCGLFKKGR